MLGIKRRLGQGVRVSDGVGIQIDITVSKIGKGYVTLLIDGGKGIKVYRLESCDPEKAAQFSEKITPEVVP